MNGLRVDAFIKILPAIGKWSAMTLSLSKFMMNSERVLNHHAWKTLLNPFRRERWKHTKNVQLVRQLVRKHECDSKAKCRVIIDAEYIILVSLHVKRAATNNKFSFSFVKGRHERIWPQHCGHVVGMDFN